MSITLWILTGYCFTTILLYIISLIKKIPLMGKIVSGFMLPNLSAISIIILAVFLPDSFHIIFITSIVFFLASIAEILFLFPEIRLLKILSRLLFILSQLFWLDIFKSTFYINRVPSWLSSICIVFDLLLFTGLFLFTGKQSITKYCTYFIALIITLSVNFCTFITLCFERNLHSICQFGGSFITCGLVIYYILNHTRFNFKYKNSIILCLLIFSQGLISAGNILMIR